MPIITYLYSYKYVFSFGLVSYGRMRFLAFFRTCKD